MLSHTYALQTHQSSMSSSLSSRIGNRRLSNAYTVIYMHPYLVNKIRTLEAQGFAQVLHEGAKGLYMYSDLCKVQGIEFVITYCRCAVISLLEML